MLDYPLVLLSYQSLIKLAKSLNLRPPLPFAWHSLSHFAQWMLLCSLFTPHQKSATALWIFSHKVVRSLKTLIAYADTAWTTALIRIYLPPLEKNLLCELEILLKILNLISLKKLIFFLPTIEGNPKFFSCFNTIFSWKIYFIAFIYSAEVLPLKNMDDFLKLKIWPDATA